MTDVPCHAKGIEAVVDLGFTREDAEAAIDAYHEAIETDESFVEKLRDYLNYDDAVMRLEAADRISQLVAAMDRYREKDGARIEVLEATLREIVEGPFIDDPPGYAASQMRTIARRALEGR